MSCDYDVRCLECDAWLGLDMNRGGWACEALIARRGALALLATSIAEVPDLDCDLAIYGHGFRADFFAEHQGPGHTLLVCDEYGRFSDECGEYVWEPHVCNFTCRRPKGHTDYHAPVRDDGR